jgi:hypothetical protein
LSSNAQSRGSPQAVLQFPRGTKTRCRPPPTDFVFGPSPLPSYTQRHCFGLFSVCNCFLSENIFPINYLCAEYKRPPPLQQKMADKTRHSAPWSPAYSSRGASLQAWGAPQRGPFISRSLVTALQNRPPPTFLSESEDVWHRRIYHLKGLTKRRRLQEVLYIREYYAKERREEGFFGAVSTVNISRLQSTVSYDSWCFPRWLLPTPCRLRPVPGRRPLLTFRLLQLLQATFRAVQAEGRCNDRPGGVRAV